MINIKSLNLYEKYKYFLKLQITYKMIFLNITTYYITSKKSYIDYFLLICGYKRVRRWYY